MKQLIETVKNAEQDGQLRLNRFGPDTNYAIYQALSSHVMPVYKPTNYLDRAFMTGERYGLSPLETAKLLNIHFNISYEMLETAYQKLCAFLVDNPAGPLDTRVDIL